MAKKNPELVIVAVYDEFLRAQAEFKTFHSLHEGFGVMLEEFVELFLAIMASKDPYAPASLKCRTEAKHVAATAIRFIVDLCGETLEEYSARAREMPER